MYVCVSFSPFLPDRRCLFRPYRTLTPGPLLLADLVLDEVELTDHLRVSLLQVAVQLLGQFAQLYRLQETLRENFALVVQLLDGLDAQRWPAATFQAAQELQDTLNHVPSKRIFLRLQAHKPVPLNQLEPAFADAYFGRTRAGDKDERAIKRLQIQHKRELKGAVRELKKDARYVANVRLKEQLEKDEDRYVKQQATVWTDAAL